MRKIACLLKGYPRLSETFIAQEIHALEQAGIDIVIYSMRYPTDVKTHPIHSSILAPVRYLPEYLYQNPIRVLKGLVSALKRPSFKELMKVFWGDLKRDSTTNRIRRLGQAMVMAGEIDSDRDWIYAHFLHTPSSVARYCAILTGLPWSCSAHAKDIWTSPKWEISEKIGHAQWLTTCTATNYEYLRSLNVDNSDVNLIYHGLDLSRFPIPPEFNENDGSNSKTAIRILSVGRAVSKKGYDVLLLALASLPKDIHWQFVHIGGGELLSDLKSESKKLSIDQHIQWVGASDFTTVLENYRQSDLFVLASRIDESGDRDGLPNVLMEAMTQELACISTNISGIPELIEDSHNGLLVDSEDVQALTAAILRVTQDVKFRQRIAEQGRLDVMNRFSLESNIGSLVDKFR